MCSDNINCNVFSYSRYTAAEIQLQTRLERHLNNTYCSKCIGGKMMVIFKKNTTEDLSQHKDENALNKLKATFYKKHKAHNCLLSC